MPGLEDYASPILRAAVFRRLNPGAQISYKVVGIDEAFPRGYRDYEGRAAEAVECEIVFPDGHWITAYKEIDTVEQLRSGTKAVPPTPENLAKNETKALGRALRDAGIPQRLSELQLLMRWIASMDANTSSLPGAPKSNYYEQSVHLDPDAAAALADAFPGSVVEEEDHADAGTEDPTPEQLLAKRFAFLEGADKIAVVKYAREKLEVGNVLRAGEHAEALLDYINAEGWKNVVVDVDAPLLNDAESINARNEVKRAEAAANLGPEEPF